MSEAMFGGSRRGEMEYRYDGCYALSTPHHVVCHYGRRPDDRLLPLFNWCQANLESGQWSLAGRVFMFATKDIAMRFKLTWAG